MQYLGLVLRLVLNGMLINDNANWGKCWQVGFSIDKFQVIHPGNTSSNHSYSEDGAILDSSLKSLVQCSAAVKKASKT